MRIDLAEQRASGTAKRKEVCRFKVWLDGRRVENDVEMADDELGEVRFLTLGMAPMLFEVKTVDNRDWHTPIHGEVQLAELSYGMVDRRHDVPGLGMVPLEVSGEVVIQRAA